MNVRLFFLIAQYMFCFPCPNVKVASPFLSKCKRKLPLPAETWKGEFVLGDM